MDIEGFEVSALDSKEVIRKFKPKLASLYHKSDDFFEIPTLIHSIEPKYKFYLDH